MARLRPYLVRSTYDWIVDHELTPYIVVDAEHELAEVPYEYVKRGRIVLNISPQSISGLHLDDDFLSFHASFSGKDWHILVPIEAIISLYAKENGQGIYAREDYPLGMYVNEGDSLEDSDPNPDIKKSQNTTSAKPKKGFLKVVK